MTYYAQITNTADAYTQHAALIVCPTLVEAQQAAQWARANKRLCRITRNPPTRGKRQRFTPVPFEDWQRGRLTALEADR